MNFFIQMFVEDGMLTMAGQTNIGQHRNVHGKRSRIEKLSVSGYVVLEQVIFLRKSHISV